MRNRKWVLAVVVVVLVGSISYLAVSANQTSTKAPSKPGWNLTFEDNFEGNQLDSSKWELTNTSLPAQMEVDYVRVYQKDN